MGGKALVMDNLTYGYNLDASGNNRNNRLGEVRDAATQSAAYTEDIDDQPVGNYRYDAIGNLVADSSERISQIDWSVYGKILSITKRNPAVGEVERISYTYDAAGKRIRKRVETRQRPDQHTCYCKLPLKP